MFATRSDEWAAVGLEVEVNERHVRRAVVRLVVASLLLIGCVIAKDAVINNHSEKWVGKTPVTIAAVAAVVVLGWEISRDLARIAPAFFKRMDPATAGTVEFLIRFVAVAATVLGALAVGGVSLQALAVG